LVEVDLLALLKMELPLKLTVPPAAKDNCESRSAEYLTRRLDSGYSSGVPGLRVPGGDAQTSINSGDVTPVINPHDGACPCNTWT